MKKLFCVLLCLLLTATALVGCGDVDRNKWLGEGVDEDGKIIEVWTQTINAYIIDGGDAIDVRGTIFRVEK